ncbi:MAG TPA: hypothetical protein VM818_02055 [Vicinamibacterales bacterium]|nr:hypothetical protein [Vicinamibacterales bacterium]
MVRGTAWAATTPSKILEEGRRFNGSGLSLQGRGYDIAPDGRRFLMIKESAGSESTTPPASLVVVQHFDEELKRLVPTNP